MKTGTWVNESHERSGPPEWPLVMLTCGHPASAREALRQTPEAFCEFCAKWVEKV